MNKLDLNSIPVLGQEELDPINNSPIEENKRRLDEVFNKGNFQQYGRTIPSKIEAGSYFEPYGGVRPIDENVLVDQLVDIPQARAEAQSGWGLLGRALAQGVTETTLGMGEGIGYVLDFEELFNADKQATEGFDNWFSEAFRTAKEHVQEEWFPVYQTHRAQEGSLWERLGDATFWASQGKTIGTTLSLMIPSFGVAGAVGKIGKISQLGAATSDILAGMSAATFSRKAESAMEANQSFQQEYQKYIDSKMDDSTARSKAGQTAATTFKANAAMLPMDMLQYTLALKSFKGLKSSLDAVKETKLGKIGEYVLQMGSEAGEEAYQFVAQQEAINQVRNGTTPFGEDFGKRLADYIEDPEFQTSAFLGGFMGGLFEGVAPIARKATAVNDNLVAKKLASSYLQDPSAFNKIDNAIKGKILAKGIVSGNLDTVIQRLDDLNETYQQDDKYTDEDKKSYKERVNQFKEEIKYVQNADKALQESDSKYIKNPKLRKKYTLLKWEDRLNTQDINKLDIEESKLLDDFTGIRDNAVYSNRQIKVLQNIIKNLQNTKVSKENEELKQQHIDSYTKQLESLKETTKDLIESAKQEDPSFDVNKYTSPNLEQLLRVSEDLYRAKTRRDVELRPQMAQIEQMSGKKAAEEESNINKRTEQKAKETIAQSIEDAINTSSPEEIDDIAGRATGTPLEPVVADAINKKAEEESPDYEIDEVPNLAKIYATEKGAIASIHKDFQHFRKKIADVTEALEDPDVMTLVSENDVNRLNTALSSIAEKAKTNNSLRQVLDIVKDYYNTKYKQQQSKITNQQNYTQPIVDFEEGSVDIQSETDQFIPNPLRSANSATIWEMEFIPRTNILQTEPGSKEPIPAKSKAITDKDYNPNIVNNSKKFSRGTQIRFEVNLDDRFNPKERPSEEFAIQLVAYEGENRRVLSLVPSLSSVDKVKDPEGYNKLKQLREDIYRAYQESGKTSGIFKSDFYSKIEEKHAGRIWVRDTYFKPHEIVEGTNQKIYFGIVTEKAGEKVLEVPNAPSEYTRTIDASKLPAGAVYMMLPASNGTIIPVRAFTKKIGSFTTEDGKNKYANQIYKDIKNLVSKKNTPEETVAAIKDIQKIAFLKIEFGDKSITLYTKSKKYSFSKDGIINNDEVTVNNFKELIYNLPLQVDINQINRTVGKVSYNEQVSKEGRLTLNVNPKRWTHSTRFNFDLNYTKQEVVKPKIQIIDISPGEDLLGFNEPKQEVTSAPAGVNTESGKIEATVSKASPFGKVVDEGEITKSDEVKVDKKVLDSKKSISKIPKGSGFKTKLVNIITGEYQRWNRTEELSWLKKNLPKELRVEEIEGLINLDELVEDLHEINRTGGKYAWGVFSNAAIYLSSQAKVGTTYHEAFHAVFNLFLSSPEIEQILNEAKAKYGDLSVLDLEERLADEFADYRLTKEEPSLGQRIINFFKRLYQLITVSKVSSINNLFDRIDTGYYKNKSFSRDITQFKSPTRYKRVPGLTVEEQYKRVTNIADSMRRVITDLSGIEENLNKTRSEIIKEYELKQIALAGYENLRDHYQSNDNVFTDAQKQQFSIMLNEFLTTDENGDPSEDSLFGELGKAALRQLAQSEGLKLDFKGIPVSNIDSSTDQEVFDLDETESKLEGWQVKVQQMSAKDRATGKMRSELSYIREIDKNNEPKRDDLGLPVYLPFNEAFSTIIREMSDNFTIEDMLSALEELVDAKNVFRSLFDKVNSDLELQNLFFQAFQNTFMDYKMMTVDFNPKTKKNDIKWFSANRQGVVNSIIDEWRNNHSDPDSNVLINGDIAKLKARYEDIRKSIGVNNFSDVNRVNLNRLLSSVGINVSLDEINALNELKMRKGSRLEEFWKNIKPVLNRYFNNETPYEGSTAEDTSLKAAALQLKILRYNLQESSHMNVEGKQVYSHVVSNFIAKQTKQVLNKEYRDKYMATEFYSEMPWFTQINNNEEFYKENFGYVVLDGLKEDNVSTKYDDLNRKQLETIRINAFLNNNNKKSLAYYQMPILSDAPNGVYIQAEKFANDTESNGKYGVLDFLVDVAFSEWKRIQSIDILGIEYKNFNSNGKKFLFIPTLNGKENLFKNADRVKVKEEIRKYLDSNIQNELKDLTTLGVIKKVGIKYESDLIASGHGYSNVEELIKNYFYNAVLANTQLIVMYQGDPAFYGGTTDFFKRAKEVWSPGILLNTKAKFKLNSEQAVKENSEYLGVKPVYTTKYIKDVKIKSKLKEDIQRILVDKGLSVENAKLISDRYDDVNLTDAQAFISLRRYREIQVGLSRWNKNYQDTFYDIIEGKVTDDTRKITYQPIKPFMFTHTFENGMVIPVQNKNSEFLLLPSLAYRIQGGISKPTVEDRENNYNRFLSPTLARILDDMQRDSYGDTNYVDSIQFESAVKVGLSGVTSIEEIANAPIHRLSNQDYRLQQETPDHFTDDFGVIGTQIRKLIIGDIADNAEFFVYNALKPMSKLDLIGKYHEVISADVLEGFNKITDRLDPPKDINNKTEWNKYIDNIQKMLLEEVENRNMGDEMVEALGTYTDKDGFKRFNLPLYHPLHAYRVESLIGSLYKNSIVKQKAPGGNVVQVSGVGFSEDLNIIIENGAIKAFECYLPWWTQKYFKPLLDENGELDINKLPNELKDAVGYRIPTEDKYSMTPLRIKGFLPRNSGGAIMLPAEITLISGSDFDIDKMYLFLPQFKVKYDKSRAKRDFERVNTGIAKLTSDMLDLVEEDMPTDNEVFNEWWNENKENYVVSPELKEEDVTVENLQHEFSKEDMSEAEDIMKYCKNKKFGR